MKRKITISESQIINAVRKVINEVRRNPETNIDESFAEFYNRMIQKAPSENIFVSFREDTHVTDVNPVNKYRTPTGYYSYPLSSFDIDENPSEVGFRRSFPFGNDREYINFFILKTHDGILTSKTDKSTLDMYVERIKKLYPNSSKVKELCDSFIDGSYSSDYNKTPVHDTHLFWLFLYDITEGKERGNRQNRINLICQNIGVNGFVDYEGHEYIHSAEPSQAVFFKVKTLGEVFIYEKPKVSGVMIKRFIQEGQYETIQNLPNDNKVIKLLDDYNMPNKYGIVDKDDNLVTKQWFSYIYEFKDYGLAWVKLNDEYNLINQNGELISKQWFDYIGSFEDGLARVKLGNEWNLLKQNGEVISNEWFDWVDRFQGGFAAVKLDNKWNLLKQNGELLFPNKWFDNITNFRNGFATVELNLNQNVINRNGEILSKQWFDWVDPFRNGFARVRMYDKGVNFINQNGEIMSEQWFDEIIGYKDGVARVILNNKIYMVDLNNKSITEIN